MRARAMDIRRLGCGAVLVLAACAAWAPVEVRVAGEPEMARVQLARAAAAGAVSLRLAAVPPDGPPARLERRLAEAVPGLDVRFRARGARPDGAWVELALGAREGFRPCAAEDPAYDPGGALVLAWCVEERPLAWARVASSGRGERTFARALAAAARALFPAPDDPGVSAPDPRPKVELGVRIELGF